MTMQAVVNEELSHKQMKYHKINRLISLAAIIGLCGGLAYLVAFLLRFDGQLDSEARHLVTNTLLVVVAIKTFIALGTRLHQEFTRYVTFHDMLLLAKTVTCCSVGICVFDQFLMPRTSIPRSVILLDWGTTLLFLAAARTVPRLIHDNAWRTLMNSSRIPVLIVGANDAGEALLRVLRQSHDCKYQPKGFVDNQPNTRGRRIGGVPILGDQNDLSALVAKHNIQEVLLTADSLSGKAVRKIVEVADRNNFKVKILPSYEQLLENRVDVHPRSVAISDLLRRPSVELDTQSIQKWISGRTVLVTGSSGSIGSEICRQILAQKPQRLVLVDRSETGQFFLERELKRMCPGADFCVVLADLTDRNRMEKVFSQYRPDIIFHAAAYKHVPLMEAHIGEAVKNIVLATRNMVDLSEKFRAESFVMISTDKAVNPTSVMGSCKRLAEQYVQAKAETSDCRLTTVRFGNVLDSAGSVVPVFREQIARGGPVTVTHPEMIRFFMLIPEAAQLVIQAGEMGQGGEIFVLDMGEPVKIMDLATDMIRLSGLRVDEDIEIQITGLRPGEKLYEELYSDQEEHSRTKHSKIMVAASESRQLLTIINDINRLLDMADDPNEDIRAVLTEIIPLHPTKTVAASALQHAA